MRQKYLGTGYRRSRMRNYVHNRGKTHLVWTIVLWFDRVGYFFILISMQDQCFTYSTLNKPKIMWVIAAENKAESYAELHMWNKEWIILGNSSCRIEITVSFVTQTICATLLMICTLWKVWLCLDGHFVFMKVGFRYSATQSLQLELTCTDSCWQCLGLGNLILNNN